MARGCFEKAGSGVGNAGYDDDLRCESGDRILYLFSCFCLVPIPSLPYRHNR